MEREASDLSVERRGPEKSIRTRVEPAGMLRKPDVE
jgi:hypothetical protein